MWHKRYTNYSYFGNVFSGRVQWWRKKHRNICMYASFRLFVTLLTWTNVLSSKLIQYTHSLVCCSGFFHLTLFALVSIRIYFPGQRKTRGPTKIHIMHIFMDVYSFHARTSNYTTTEYFMYCMVEGAHCSWGTTSLHSKSRKPRSMGADSQNTHTHIYIYGDEKTKIRNPENHIWNS